MGDITIGSILIPSAVASVVSAVWEYVARRDLRRAESRLLRQEESFRVSHSPRVAMAIELWTALRDYERTWVAVHDPMPEVKVPPGTTLDCENMDHFAEQHRREGRAQLRSAWEALRKARDKAEVILPRDTFRPFDELFSAYYGAHDADETLRMPLTDESRKEVAKRRSEFLLDATNLHPVALRAFQALLEPDDG